MMASDLNNTTIKEFFQKKNWKENNDLSGNEIIYDFSIVNTSKVIRVYTSISKTSQTMREKGKDAIRLFLFDVIEQKPKSKSFRVYRTENWKENLKNKVNILYNSVIK
jgi:hypothetical protein